MPLKEFVVALAAERVEAFGDAALAAGALSVAVEDADRDGAEEHALYGEPGEPAAPAAWARNRVRVLVEESCDVALFLEAIAADGAGPAPAVLEVSTIDDCDWVRQTQAQFAPIPIGPIWIVPSWHEPPDPSAINVRIDPGIAFGTGGHPTTRLCIEWLARHPLRGACVLDYGCGSGILAICAARLGAAAVVGVDIDAQALDTARENATVNGVDARFGSPESLAGSPPFDIVIANILAHPLIVLAPALVRHARAGGVLLLSGILERQAETVRAAFARALPGLELAGAGSDEGWVALAATRPA